MKVLFYINVLGGGGAERVIVNLANQFAQNKDNEIVLVASYPIDNEYYISDFVRRIYLDEVKRDRSFLARNIYYVRKLRKLIKNIAPNAVVSFMAEPNIRMLLATRGLKPRKIISIRNDPLREYNNFVSRAIAKSIFSWADSIVFQTKDAQRFFSTRIQKKSVVIMNQIDEKFFDEDVATSRKDIVTAGRLTAQKNHKLLIDAFAKISDSIEDNLIIYGKGELEQELKDYVEQIGLEHRINIPGATSNIIGAIKAAKAFVLSSDYEGMPNALLEALALGIPCISTDCPCGGPKTLICDGENGFLVPVNDVDELANRMKHLIDNPEIQHSFSVESRKAMEAFRPEKIFSEWERTIIS